MQILVVVDDDTRRTAIVRLVRQALSESVVLAERRGVDVRSDMIIEAVQSSKRFDLIIHHCGATNQEYDVFAKKYRSLCSERSWQAVPLVVFSGDPAAVSRAASLFQGNSFTCAVLDRDLLANLGTFLVEWDDLGGKALEIPWDTLLGIGSSESALQTLSALLPIGLEWDMLGGQKGEKEAAAKKMRTVTADGDGVSEYERLLQQYACACIENSGDSGRQRSELLHNIWVKRLARNRSDGPGTAETVIDEVKQLCLNATNVVEWNIMLGALRDRWLGTVET